MKNVPFRFEHLLPTMPHFRLNNVFMAQENSRRVGDCARKTNQMRVDKILKDFELIRHSIDVIGHLRQESLFMEDNDSENLLREERMRQLRDEILILDQASKRPDIPS